MEGRLDDIPHLISIAVGAFPHLDLVSTGQAATGEIEAFVHIGPGNAVVRCDGVLLVLVA